jgi:hypothetical protein
MQLTPEIENALAGRPDLLRAVKETIHAANSEKGFRLPFEVKALTTAEQKRLHLMLGEAELSSTSPKRRGELVKATLELRGLGNLFAAPPDGK